MRTSYGINFLKQRFNFKISKRSMGSVGMNNGRRRLMMMNPLVEKETLDPCVVLMKQIIAKHEGAWKKRNDEIYSLAQGVVYWSPPSQAYQYMDQYKDELHLYAPDEGWPAFRSSLEKKLQKRNGLFSPHFMVTSGANQAFTNVVLTLMNGNSSDASNRKALFFVPYYFNHVMAVQMVHGNDAVVLGPVDLHTGYPDIQWLEEKLNNDTNKDISMVTIANPGNPTGVNIPPEMIQQLASLCKEQQVWLVLDHTYEDFRYDESSSEEHQQPQQMDQNSYFPQLDNVIHIFSMSKGYAMAGFRVGYVVLPSEQMYNAMLKVQDTIAICAPKLSQVAALGALQWRESEDGEPDWVHARVQSLKQGRDAILQALKPLSQILGGSGAMYLMAKLPEIIEDDVVSILKAYPTFINKKMRNKIIVTISYLFITLFI